SFPGFLARSGKHFRRGVNAVDTSFRSDTPLRCDRKSSGSAAHVKYGFAGFETRELNHSFTKSPFPAEHCEPNHEIVPSSRTMHHSCCFRHWIANRRHHIALLLPGFYCRLESGTVEERYGLTCPIADNMHSFVRYYGL